MFKRILAIFLPAILFCSLLLAKEDYPFLGLVTKDNINVRAGANINFEPLCKLVANEKVTVVGKTYNWYKIILPKDAICFVSERYLKVEDSIGLITANRVNMRARPAENSSIIGQVNKDERVKILKKNGQWYGVEPIDKCFGWVHENFIRYYAQVNKETEVIAQIASTAQPQKEANIKTENKTQFSAKEPSVENTVSAVGVVEPMGRVFNRKGSHKLVSDGKIIYILSGDRNLLDSFINYRVKIVGERNNLSSSKNPVIVVKQISPCQ